MDKTGKFERIKNNAYRLRHRKVDVELGDLSTPGFKPKLRLNRWGGECFLDIDFSDAVEEEEIEEETDAQGNITKVKWKTKTVDDELELEYHAVDKARLESVVSGACNQCGKCCVYYHCPYYDSAEPDTCSIHIDKVEQQQRNGETYENWMVRRDDRCPACFRPKARLTSLWSPECGFNVDWERIGELEETFVFDIFLKKMPLTNIWSFPIITKGLTFTFQPPLTPAEVESGHYIRPPNVEGSYAVYHATKKNNQYETGKAFHIYRPEAEDALGNKAWCELNISDGKITVMVPQAFLDGAIYPVTIDPDFGYTNVGGSWLRISDGGIPGGQFDGRAGSAWLMPAGGTANYLRARVKGDTTTSNCKAFVNQRNSGGAGNHGQIIAPVENLACAQAEHWEEFTFGDEELTGGVNYILNILSKSGAAKSARYFLAYDVIDAVDSYFEHHDYAAPESPWVVNAEGITLDYSIFVNYTSAGWAGKFMGIESPANVAKIMGIPIADIAKVMGVG